MSFSSEITWYTVDEKTPEIPEDKFGLSLLVIAYDKDFAECSDRDPYYVTEIQYSYTRDRHGNKYSPWKDSDKETDFVEYLEDLYEDTEWVPFFETIVYWAYMPDHFSVINSK